MKKLITSLSLSALLVAAVPFGAFASHGGHHGARGYSTNASTTSYTICAVQNCTISGVHAHNGTNYAGHHTADGHAYHSNGNHCGGQY